MPKFTVDGLDFQSEDLNDFAKEKLAELISLQSLMRTIEAEIKVYETSQAVYLAQLKQALLRKE